MLGALISGAAYLIKRKLESKPELEMLDKHHKVLDIHKKMNEQSLDIAGLNAFATLLTEKSSSVQSHVQELNSESISCLVASDNQHLTQMEMNQLASESYIRSIEKLNQVYIDLTSKLDNEQGVLYENSQSKWQEYSESHARSVASNYKGGSIYPLIYYSELETLVHERTARLQSELDELVSLGN